MLSRLLSAPSLALPRNGHAFSRILNPIRIEFSPIERCGPFLLPVPSFLTVVRKLELLQIHKISESMHSNHLGMAPSLPRITIGNYSGQPHKLAYPRLPLYPSLNNLKVSILSFTPFPLL